MSNGHNFGGSAAMRHRDQLRALSRENARRVPCKLCTLRILPEDMGRHLDVVHDEVTA